MGMTNYTDNIYISVKIEKDQIKDIGKEIGKQVADNTGTGLKDGIKTAFAGVNQMLKTNLVNIVHDLATSVVGIFKDAAREMNEMLEFSQLSNANTRELLFGYGFSSSEAYGWTKAMNQLGFESEEDLMYANTQEIEQFRKAFEKYANYYDELAESGYFEKIQEYQVAMEDFKMEMQQEVIQFFIDNKDDIMSAMKAILTISSWIIKGFSWLMHLTSSDNTAATTDIVSQYNNTNTSNSNASLNVVNNFNNVDNSTSNAISREVDYEYRQVIIALGGKV